MFAAMLSPNKADASAVGVQCRQLRAAPSQRLEHCVDGILEVAIQDELRWQLGMRIDDDRRALGRQHGQGLSTCRDHEIGAEQDVDLAARNAVAMHLGHRVSDAYVRQHGAKFLRQAGLVELDHGLAFKVRSEPDETARRDDPRPANAGDQNIAYARQ